MRILAIEAACPPGSVALVSDDTVIAYRLLGSEGQKTTAEYAVAIRDILRESGWAPSSIGLVTTTSGPGSFTGLRIGVTAAKVFAYATGAAVMGVNTLEVIASQTSAGSVNAVLDAQRGELFSAIYEKSSGQIQTRQSSQIVNGQEWLDGLSSATLVTGLGLRRFRDQVPSHVPVVDENEWRPRADQLGLLAAQKAARKKDDEPTADAWSLVPQYFRKSAAEEKAEMADRSK